MRTAVRGNRAGFTVLELTAMATVLVVGVLGVAGSIASGLRLAAVRRETGIAEEAARVQVERMKATPVQEIYAACRGSAFPVAGLAAPPDDADGLPGEVLFPATEIGGIAVLSESLDDPRFGMPRDLDGDGVISTGALPHPCMVLPVRVRVRWRGAGGDRSFDLDEVLVAGRD